MGNATNAIVGVLVAVVGLALVAVIVSKNAQTGTIITNAGTAFGSILKAAVSPVVSGTIGING